MPVTYPISCLLWICDEHDKMQLVITKLKEHSMERGLEPPLGTVSRESLQKYKSAKTHLQQWQATRSGAFS